MSTTTQNEVNFYQAKKGIMSWVYTIDHKRIGIMYLIASSLALFAGGAFALMIRAQLATPGGMLPMTPEYKDTYNMWFTLHGVIMVFLFIIPAIPAALGNFILPLMVGAKDVAFPKMNLASFYIYVIGACVALYGIVGGESPLTTGWTFYLPYSKETAGAVITMTLAAFILGFSSIFTGINFIVTIHKLRAPGMSWYKMPLFLWALYATSILQVLATPVLGITLLLLIAERTLQVGIFDPALGGDPVLFQHFFWFYSHPAVYIMILPGMGVISEVISCFSRKVIFGYKAIANSSIAIAVISFLVWGHHMFLSGQSVYAGLVFSFLTFLVAIPSAIKVFNWVATLHRGSITFETPMCYALSFLFLFTIGGLTGLPLATLSTDIVLHDTYYVVAHFHYVMFGGTVIAFFSGLHFYWPKMVGKMYNETVGKVACIIVFIGFNVTFFSQFFLGYTGMPRRYFTYDSSNELWSQMHGFSSIGAFILGFGVLILFANLIASLFSDRKAPNNPWGATTMDWETQSPPVLENFSEDVPVMKKAPYEYE
ncbi:cytochrome oxidase subunit I [Lentisphaera araneosa HTCC2155]|uniref:Cytochrome oxidase subunit I n=1 Tax=Lentisphaera araneosa HTCC2155 TaxID=313628 RepID=A6DSP1_9BACT|nr:cbb3-type cytochrome c oxidase subunit I [Lentisphaera araneosa]EDM25294.1 cytochrome oxidase subunit I [Lentisphaera araneosa HTCC2155]